MTGLLVAALVNGRAQRVLALVVLAAMVFGLWWFGSRPARTPRSLGRLGGRPESEPREQRGIGRFARTRATRPPRL